MTDSDLEADYKSGHSDRVSAAIELEGYLTKLLDAAGINYLSVAGRAKAVDSFLAKAAAVDENGNAKYAAPLNEIKDQVALRVITYLPETVEAACELIRANFEVLEEIDKAEENEARGIFGYASRHLVLELTADRKVMVEYKHSAALEFEVQVRTTLQHAWAEFEHDVRYKGEIPEAVRGKFNRRFALAAGLIELADSQFSAINAELEKLEVQESGKIRTPATRISPETLAPWLLGRYPEAQRSKTGHYVWMHELLTQLGMTTFEDLESTLAGVSSDAVAEAIDHLYPAGGVRRLDDDLLAALGRSYLTAAHNTKRASMLEYRLQKLKAGI